MKDHLPAAQVRAHCKYLDAVLLAHVIANNTATDPFINLTYKMY